MPGKLATELGPVWSGDIFCKNFISDMIKQCQRFSWAKRTVALLEQILLEALCPKGDVTLKALLSTNKSANENKADEDEESPAKKPRLECNSGFDENNHLTESAVSNTPAFYFNLHRHSPKGPQLLRADKVVQCLHQAGYRASRTHFDREAVRTNASLSDLLDVLKKCSVQVKK